MWHKPPNAAEKAVSAAVTNAVVTHLNQSARVAPTQGRADADPDFPWDPGAEPVLIQVDGPGRTMFLEHLGAALDPTRRHGARRTDDDGNDWIAVRFDAWRYQRVAPPWWWLMSALDKQIRVRLRRTSWSAWAAQRLRDYGVRGLRLGADLLLVVPFALMFLVGLHFSDKDTGMTGILSLVDEVAKLGGAVLGILLFVSSIGNALRRHLLAQSPRGASAILRSSDPMAELQRRYRFLVRSARRPIVVLIDNLDRCRAEYVVEMLEGIQTLLRDPLVDASDRASSQRPFIAFVVAADREWLCESYLHVYDEFKGVIHQPGRPFGLLFVDKVFDVALRIPTVSPALAPAATAADRIACDPTPNPFDGCHDEGQVRSRLGELEDASTDAMARLELRRHAVEHLARIEVQTDPWRRQCADTERQLDRLLEALNPGSMVQRQLDVAYCVKRTTQLLAGHDIDEGDDAIALLAMWTILELRWPLLSEHLTREREDLACLGSSTPPGVTDADLGLVFTDPLASRLAEGVEGADGGQIALTVDHVKQFTVPGRGATTTDAGDRVEEPAAGADALATRH